MDTFDHRVDRAALEGAVSRKPTLVPLMEEVIAQARRALDETQKQMDELDDPPFSAENGSGHRNGADGD